jgi:hypothetical protein
MSSAPERRSGNRRKVSFYMPVTDADTGELVGHLVEISDLGIRLDCPQFQPANKDFNLQVELTSDLADKAFMTLVARSKWCREDKFTPNTYNVGFQVMDLDPADVAIFNLMSEKYGE